ncbi:MAG: TIGR03617 family F420-dependent LLM class oxidoreductase [Deltaproteobacteria bacterium]|nr:TIGR03617 family F420-dependent LLM class oxidoreductase [Deltaproteobacteria bacterium]
MPFRVETVILAPGTEQYGGAAQDPLGIDAIVGAAKRAEEAGFDGVTVPEGGHDPFLPLVLAAEHTTRVRLGTNVAIAFPRSPMVTAQLAWDLQRLSGGRFVLGLGTQSRAHVERRYAAEWKEPAGPRLRDYVGCLRAMFESFQRGGRPQRFESDHYRFDLLPAFSNPGPIAHPHVPIHLGAVNVFGARLVGELLDGIRVHPIATFRYVREVLVPSIQEGAARGGRSRSEVEIVAAPFLVTAPDEAGLAAAKAAARQHVAFYAINPGFHAVLDHHGWGGLASELAPLLSAGRLGDLGSVISDAMLDEWAVVATWDRLAAAIEARCAGTFDTVLLDLPPDLASDALRRAALVRALRGADAGHVSHAPS